MRLIASHYTSNVGRCHNIRSSWPPMKGWKSKSWEFTNSPTLKLSVLLLILTLTTPPKVAQHKSKSLRVPKLEKVWKYLIQIFECLKQIVEYLKQIVDYLKQIAEYLKYCLGILGSYACTHKSPKSPGICRTCALTIESWEKCIFSNFRNEGFKKGKYVFIWEWDAIKMCNFPISEEEIEKNKFSATETIFLKQMENYKLFSRNFKQKLQIGNDDIFVKPWDCQIDPLPGLSNNSCGALRCGGGVAHLTRCTKRFLQIVDKWKTGRSTLQLRPSPPPIDQ